MFIPTSFGMYITYPNSPVCVRFIVRMPFARPTSSILKVKKGKFFGLRSVSVNSDNNVLVKGPIMQRAVNILVTSDIATVGGRCFCNHTLHLVCCIVGAIIM